MTRSSQRTMFEGVKTARPTFEADDVKLILADVAAVLAGGVLTQGEQVALLEREFGMLCGAEQAVAVSTGTSALEIALRAFGVDGKDVLVPTNTFLSTANAVAFAGGRPVFTDIDPATLCIGVGDFERALTPRAAGVIVVHIAGLICPDIDAIRALCRSRGLFVLEDAAHAHGATIGGRRAGSLGDAAAFSFFATKPMTSGEGGMITTDLERIASFSRLYRSHGVDGATALHVTLGNNYRLTEIAAILARHQLRKLGELLRRRAAIAAVYDRAFVDGVLQPIAAPRGDVHSYYKYALVFPDRRSRTAVAERLQAMGVPTGGIYDPPCHLHPYAQDAYGVKPGDFPKAEDVLPRVMCLPIHASLTEGLAGRIADAVLQEARSELS